MCNWARMKTLQNIAIFLSYVHVILCSEEVKNTERVIVVGAGASGIAAASKLLENGFTDVKILEAENRIGGRVYSTEFGEYLIDLGGQWVHGEKNNTSFELAWPLGLLEHMDDNGLPKNIKLFGSSGEEISGQTYDEMFDYYSKLQEKIESEIDKLKTGSVGEFTEQKMNEYFKSHPDIPAHLHNALLYLFNLLEMALLAANDWHQVSAHRVMELDDCAGDLVINWKNRTYGMILDLLMKKYPNAEEELPVMNNTMLNSKVTKITYDTSEGSVKALTEDGKEYEADHLIFTGSLGVLQTKHENLFSPSLPENTITCIQHLGMGHVAKIFLYFEEPWWIDDIHVKAIFWTDEDRKTMENDPEKKWMLSVYGVMSVEHKPKLLCVWLTGRYVRDMELVPDDVLRNQTMELLHRFYGHAYNITELSMLKRSLWNTNDNFLGTYSYPTLDTYKLNIYPSNLSEPIINDDRPLIQFAGEATAYYYGTVHGAIDSGRREASRLIDYYSSKKPNA